METPASTPLDKILDLLLDAVCVVDAEGHYVFVSAAFERIFGYAPAEVIGRQMLELVHPEDRELTLRTAAAIMDGKHASNFQNRYVRKDGQVVHIMWSARWSGEDRLRIAVARDITELKRAESMRLALHAISETAHAAQDLSTVFGQVHRIVGDILPMASFVVALRNPADGQLDVPYAACGGGAPPTAGSLAAEVIRGNQVVQSATGGSHWLGVPLYAKESPIGALVVERQGDAGYGKADTELLEFVATQLGAVIERKQDQVQLHHLALHDPLTDLPNRTLFRNRLQATLGNASRAKTLAALLYIDLDGFKQVNDLHGHAVGDLLLCEVAARIRGCLREHDTAARIGGDEFVVLLDTLAAPGHAVEIAERIRTTLTQTFLLQGQMIRISASIGVATFPLDGETSEQLGRAADRAMYQAKKAGGNRTRAPDKSAGADLQEADARLP
ncbi:GGDEF domain-containing protein [Rhodanobacter sp. DHB23]|uniref:GGDEF domain-containing protein n=1 Tax=Rhodanobacter sp. DHB23 TaxID=2775923 RepID=UPI00178708ED|nr:GGDEF domain-containing protein [Rhodanobacter sp. DHB23]MBD8872056.1 diguanylate cyclase [Rhodanobacter sp. DHB23]